MTEARWTNPSQPQTLQIAVFLLYAHAVFGVLDILRYGVEGVLGVFPWGPLYLLTLPAAVLAGRAVASEQKWGYPLAVAVAVSPFVLRILLFGSVSAALNVGIITLMFDIALVALLLHPMSRDYQRMWFK